ncbi:AAA family ATPase [Methylovulum psychrotolerans]|uniref:KGGVGR-motif variant AAA ATPase n=1 Tax=Methylovulum psychrotolerans TaxID=1704499 RepID=UPI001BFF42C3|nr:AAA family ATPase [Methylovulum psychrotolerans]MBT9099200.1 AAA family ATPase [Methylovulum psychrotolerans]
MNTSAATPDTLTRFIAFYSYKGGVGRTLALANCARTLAAKGKKIVLLDLDLEAPGLLHFEALQPKSRNKNPAGFADCLENGPPDSLDDYIHECRGKKTDRGTVWLMPAGRHNGSDYLGFLNGMTWNDFYTQQEGYKILENLRGHIIDRFNPDYVFMDARTGLSEIGGIATHQLADIVVLVFNLNGQNITGAKRVFDSIRDKAPLNPKIILVASPVPVMPTEKGTPFAKKMQTIRRDFSGAYNNDKPLVIPYHPLLAFEDRLLVDDGDLFSSDAPYRRLVEIIQKVAEVDADFYLQQMAEPMQKGDSPRVISLALQGLEKNKTDIYLLFNLASAYYFTGEKEKSLISISEILRHHADSMELSKQELVAASLYNKGLILNELHQPEDEIAVYDELLRRFGDATEPALQERIAKALINKGVTLGQLQQPEDEIAAYDELLGRFGGSTEPALQEQVAKALINKGTALGQLQQPEDEIAAYDELLGRFGSSTEPALQEQVANALYNKGVTLGQLQQPEDEIAAYDELLRRFGDATEPVLQERIAKALINKGVALGQLQQPEDEITAYDELLRLFGGSTELALQEPVTRALNSKGFTILLQAKNSHNNPERKQTLLQKALDNFAQALTRTPTEIHAIILGNQAYTLFLLGGTAKSESFLKTALTLGGQALYDSVLTDSRIHSLPEDEDFRILLDRLWQETQSAMAGEA